MDLAPLLIALLAAAPAPTGAEVLARAEAAFTEALELREQPAKARPLFHRAAELYAELHRRGARNAALYRNEGNAWLLAGELPRALLAYRRGLRLDPADRALQECLAHAREQVLIPPSAGAFGRPPTDDRPPWLPRVTLSAWPFALLWTWYVLSCGLLARWLMTRRGPLLLYGVGGLVLSAAAGVLLGVLTYHERRAAEEPVVVIARDGVVLRRGNGDVYPPRHPAPLNRGVEAKLLFRRGGWLQIELSGGEVGWVPAGAALVDEAF